MKKELKEKPIEDWGEAWFEEIINNFRIWDTDSDRTIESLIGILELNGKQFIRRLLAQEKRKKKNNEKKN